jgi:hypothetical protein
MGISLMSSASPTRRIALPLALSGVLTSLTLLVGPPARAAAPLVFATAAPLVFATATAEQRPDGSATVSWVTDGADRLLRGFEVVRRDLSTGVSTVVTTTPTTATSATDPLSDVSTGVHTFAYTVRTIGAHRPASFLVNGLPQFFKAVPSGPAEVTFLAGERSGAARVEPGHAGTPTAPGVTLAWNGPSINAARLTGYRVQRRIGPVGAYRTLVTSTTSTRLTDRSVGLGPGAHEIDYQITSLAGAAAGGVNSFPVQLFIGVPGFPAGGTARGGVTGDAQLDWDAPAQNPDLVAGYRITRRVNQGQPSTIGAVGADVRRFTDPDVQGLPTGAQVNYTVTALFTSGPGGSLPLFLTVDHRPRTSSGTALPPTGGDITTVSSAGAIAVTGGGLLVMIARRRRIRFVMAPNR